MLVLYFQCKCKIQQLYLLFGKLNLFFHSNSWSIELIPILISLLQYTHTYTGKKRKKSLESWIWAERLTGADQSRTFCQPDTEVKIRTKVSTLTVDWWDSVCVCVSKAHSWVCHWFGDCTPPPSPPPDFPSRSYTHRQMMKCFLKGFFPAEVAALPFSSFLWSSTPYNTHSRAPGDSLFIQSLISFYQVCLFLFSSPPFYSAGYSCVKSNPSLPPTLCLGSPLHLCFPSIILSTASILLLSFCLFHWWLSLFLLYFYLPAFFNARFLLKSSPQPFSVLYSPFTLKLCLPAFSPLICDLSPSVFPSPFSLLFLFAALFSLTLGFAALWSLPAPRGTFSSRKLKKPNCGTWRREEEQETLKLRDKKENQGWVLELGLEKIRNQSF